MTSELSCFVYLQIPASLEVVTCGRFVLTPLGPGKGVGRFVYGRRYRSRADVVPIDPINLALKDVTFETANLGGVFGVLRDALPDAWGRLVIERVLGRSELNEVELLLESPEDRAGALSFGLGQDPPAPVRDFNRIIQLVSVLKGYVFGIRVSSGAAAADFLCERGRLSGYSRRGMPSRALDIGTHGDTMWHRGIEPARCVILLSEL